MPELEHPEKYDKVPPHKRKRKDPGTVPSPEDKTIDWDKAHADPGLVVLDDLSGAE